MTVQKKLIQAGTPGGPLSISGIRDLDGVLYACYHDSAASPTARTKLYKSTDDGAVWAAETWSDTIGATAAAAGGDEPVLICDEANNIWCGMSRYQGVDSPHVIHRDGAAEIWGGPGVFLVGYHRFTLKTAVTSFGMISDPSRRTAGVWNIIAAYIDSGTVYVSELADGEQAIGGSSATDVRIASNSAGFCFLIYTDGGSLYYSARAPKAAKTTWLSPIAISEGGDTVQTAEAIAADQRGWPAGIYRYDGGGGKSFLKLIEITDTPVGTPTLIHTRVDTATPTDYTTFPGHSLMYDSRGSVYVVGLLDDGGLGRAEPVRWEMLRPLGVTSFVYAPVESGSSADSQDTASMGSLNPDRIGFRPNRNVQGATFWYLKDDTDFYWYNTDPYPGTGGYPTIFSTEAGDPPYREADTTDKSTIPLEGEGVAATTFPLITPQTVEVRSSTFETHGHKFEAGYRASIAKFEDGRTWIKINFDNVSAADVSTLATFIEARIEDQAPFTFPIPETDPPVSIDVFIAAGKIRKRKIPGGRWALGEFLFAEQVVF
jgi:hypothetical protein